MAGFFRARYRIDYVLNGEQRTHHDELFYRVVHLTAPQPGPERSLTGGHFVRAPEGGLFGPGAVYAVNVHAASAGAQKTPQIKTHIWYLDAAWHRHGDDAGESWGKAMVVE